MTHHQNVPKISLDELRLEIKKEYTNVALDPNKGYHFHTGRKLANLLSYDESLYKDLPEANIASFAGTGNPFSLGPINAGETVVMSVQARDSTRSSLRVWSDRRGGSSAST